MNEQELNIVVEHYENDELAAANEALADAYFSIRGEYERVVAENAKLLELASNMYKNMQGVLRLSTDTVWVNSLMTLRDCMDEHMESMAELGMPPSDYESRKRDFACETKRPMTFGEDKSFKDAMRELGIEVE